MALFNRSRAAFVLALLFTAASLGGPTANPVSADPLTPVQCQDPNLGPITVFNPSNEHVGDTLNPPNGNALGIRADLVAYEGQMAPCTYPSSDFGNDGASIWISLQPAAGNPQAGNNKAILQIGIVACNAIGFAACDVNGNRLHYFWAAGGCGTHVPTPQNIIFGPSPEQYNTFAIRREEGDGHLGGAAHYDVKINNGTIFLRSIPMDDPAVGCWINDGNKKAGVAGEIIDRGDHIGLIGAPSQFWDIEYRQNGDGSWNNWLPTCLMGDVDGEHTFKCITEAPVIGGEVIDRMIVWTEHE